MGVLGWHTIGENQELVGTVVDHGYSDGFFEGDNDWSLSIKPAPGFEGVAAGNAGGNVECEIRTAVDDKNSEKVQFGELMGKTVRVFGTWVKDISHDNKKEIHPLMLLTCDFGMVGSGFSKRYKAMVFSDHSPWVSLIPPRPSPPHARDNIHATFGLQFPPCPSDDVVPMYSIANEKNLTDSRNFSISGGNGKYTLNADIRSGHGSNSGYYRGLLDLGYDTSPTPNFVGLVHPANTATMDYLSWDLASFIGKVNENFAKNFPMTKFRTHVVKGTRLWSASFEGSGNAYFQWYMTWNEFAAKYNELWPTMNLIDVETHIDNGQRFWTALWREKVANDGLIVGTRAFLDGYIAKWGNPVNVKTYLDNGQRRWCAIFRNIGTPVDFHYDLSFQAMYNIAKSTDRALLHIEPYVQDSQRKWAVVAQHKPNDVVLTWWVNSTLFAKELQFLLNNYGLRLFDFAVCRGFS